MSIDLFTGILSDLLEITWPQLLSVKNPSVLGFSCLQNQLDSNANSLVWSSDGDTYTVVPVQQRFLLMALLSNSYSILLSTYSLPET